jgi:hypothetical protein
MEGPSLRRYLRLPLVEKIRIRSKKSRFTVRPGHGDLSMGGVFIDGRTLPLRTPVELVIETRRPIHAKGTVRFLIRRPRRGMGIEFTELSESDLKRLEDLVARIPWP